MKSLLVPFAAVVVVSLAAERADACGGLFCASQGSIPVDQTAERILFEVNDDGSVTATVEITYAGDPAAFSWIVPVPEQPTDMGVASPSLLRLLDQATVPSIIPPPFTCSADFDSGEGEGEGEAAPTAPEDDGVEVVELPNVGPYGDIVVVSSDDPEALADWLNENGYLVTDAMQPAIAAYVAEGQKFLALKLQPDVAVDEIVPVRFTCPGVGPHIPIRLTALASLPEMSIVAFVAGGGRYRPTNYRDFVVDPALVRWDVATNRYNYAALVSFLVDQEGGQAFAVERAMPSGAFRAAVDATFLGTADEGEARAELNGLFDRRSYVTRLYTRMNPEEMTEDPVFALDAAAADVSGTLDLSSQPAVDVCAVAPPRCGATYCGAGAQCAETVDGAEGCVCAADQSARRIPGPSGVDTVFCASTGTDVLGAVFTGAADPCAGFACGQGTCVGVNGAPTCACAADKAARVDFAIDRGVLCVDVVRSVPPEVLVGGAPLAPVPPGSGGGDDETGLPANLDTQRRGAFCACVAARDGAGSVASVVAALALFAGAGRRRRR